MGLTLYVIEGELGNEIFLLKDWQLLFCNKPESFRSESERKGTSCPQSGREDWVKGNRVVLRLPQGNSSGQSLWVLFEAWDE
nr:hypothetical protein Itr_chr07CG18300 [Ipomoea trifida]